MIIVNGDREFAALFVLLSAANKFPIEQSEPTLCLRVIAWWKLSWCGNKKTVKRE